MYYITLSFCVGFSSRWNRHINPSIDWSLVVDWGLWQCIYFLSWRLAGLGLKIDLVSITVETSLAALAAVRGKAIVSGIWQLKIVWNCYLCCGASCLSKWHRLYLDFLSAHHESESRTEIQIQIQIHLQIVFVSLWPLRGSEKVPQSSRELGISNLEPRILKAESLAFPYKVPVPVPVPYPCFHSIFIICVCAAHLDLKAAISPLNCS